MLDSVIKSLEKTIKNNKAQVFLFHGPSGCGKTTIARIAANEFGCDPADIIEVDAATNTGVENVRALQERLMYVPLSGGSKRAVILDEAHMLSRSAWNSLLKVLEDTPRHVVWFLCTTEFGKVPRTVVTRCTAYQLKSVPAELLKDLMRRVAREEKLKIPKAVISIIAEEAEGSPRQALVNLAKCSTARDVDEAKTLLESAIGSAQAIDLCRALVKGCSFATALKLVSQMEENPESVRIVVLNYVAAVLLKTTKKSEAQHLAAILDAFKTPYNLSEKKAPLLLSLAELLLN